jgi:hypothetical protein
MNLVRKERFAGPTRPKIIVASNPDEATRP